MVILHLLIAVLWHTIVLVVKIGEHFLSYLHARVPNATSQTLTLQNTAICIIVKYDASIVICRHDSVIVAVCAEWLAEHKCKVGTVTVAILKITNARVILLLIIFVIFLL